MMPAMKHIRLLAIVFILVVVVLAFVFAHLEVRSAPIVTTIDASAVTITDAPIPGGVDPWGLASDAQGNIWVALPGCDPNPRCAVTAPPGKLAVYNPDTLKWTASYPFPKNFGQPLFLAFDKQGVVWFPMFQTDALGSFNPATKVFHQWPIPTKKAGPWAVAIDHSGNIWFTEHFINQIGRFDPRTQTFQEFATPAKKSYPYGITIDARDNVWFTENNRAVALIGEYTSQGQLLEYPLPRTGVSITPHLIITDGKNTIWWSEGVAGRLGKLNLTQAKPGTSSGISEYSYPKPCKTCEIHTSGLGIDQAGNIWFDDSLQAILGVFSNDGKAQFKIYSPLTQYSHPHDGLLIDQHGRIWFTEETYSQLGLILKSNTLS